MGKAGPFERYAEHQILRRYRRYNGALSDLGPPRPQEALLSRTRRTAAVLAAATLAVGTGFTLDRTVLDTTVSGGRTVGQETFTASGRTGHEGATAHTEGSLTSGPGTTGSGPSSGEQAAAGTPRTSLKPLRGDAPAATAAPSDGASPPPGGTGSGSGSGGTGGSGGSGGAPASTEQATAEAAVIDLTNAQRAKAGCGALHLDARLRAAAQAHSGDMAAHHTMSHTGSDGSSPWDRMARAGYHQAGAENVAMGYATPAAVMDGWMNSPGHRANILNCKLHAIGVGVSYVGGTWWTQDFGWS